MSPARGRSVDLVIYLNPRERRMAKRPLPEIKVTCEGLLYPNIRNKDSDGVISGIIPFNHPIFSWRFSLFFVRYKVQSMCLYRFPT